MSDGIKSLLLAVMIFVAVAAVAFLVTTLVGSPKEAPTNSNIKCYITEGHPQTIECKCEG